MVNPLHQLWVVLDDDRDLFINVNTELIDGTRNSIESPIALLVKFHSSVNLQISLQIFILLKSKVR